MTIDHLQKCFIGSKVPFPWTDLIFMCEYTEEQGWFSNCVLNMGEIYRGWKWQSKTNLPKAFLRYFERFLSHLRIFKQMYNKHNLNFMLILKILTYLNDKVFPPKKWTRKTVLWLFALGEFFTRYCTVLNQHKVKIF